MRVDGLASFLLWPNDLRPVAEVGGGGGVGTLIGEESAGEST